MKKLAGIVFVIALGLDGISIAWAVTCKNGNGVYWYAYIKKAPLYGADNGALIDIYTTELSITDPASKHVDHEMWYGAANCAQWVEVGVTDGNKADFSGQVNQAVFWADQRPGTNNYHEHYPALSWQMNRYYAVEVTWAGVSGRWDVHFGGAYIGSSTSNVFGAGARCVFAGIEATSANSSDRVAGYMLGFQRKDASNSWHADWGNPTPFANCPANITFLDSNFTQEDLHGSQM